MVAGAARHRYIEKEHVLIGLCTLGKALGVGVGLDPQAEPSLQAK